MMKPTPGCKQYGLNTFKARSRSSSVILFLLQFKSPLTILLIAAALLSMGLGDFTDAIIILIIILLSSFLGFWQEKGAANAVNELLKMVQISCRIVRDGKENELPVENAVPGDIIVLSAGDVIPATVYYWNLKNYLLMKLLLQEKHTRLKKIPAPLLQTRRWPREAMLCLWARM